MAATEPTGEEALAEQAGTAFTEGNTAKALELLAQLQKQREDDPKILHNEAVSQYVLSGSGDPRKLLAVLEKLKQRADDAQSDAGEGSVADVADVDPSLTAYNTAVLLYQLKQYSRCRAILEEMFSNIEPVDEFLVFRVCFLLLDVYLLQKQAEKATEVLAYLERSFLALTKVEGSKENGDIVAPADGLQGAAAGTASSDWPNKKSARRPPTDITPEEVRGALNLYKAKLALMARMSKSSKREIKTTLNACAQNTTGLFLKSNLEYLRQNYRKAIKLLNNSCQRSDRDPNVSALYFNNMGCIHHLMRRHTAACFYFTRALQENDALYSGADKSPAAGHKIALPAFACDRRCEIHYNKGLQLLLSARPEQAFASFQEALHLFHRQPRAWLRVGEACAAAHIQQMQAAQAARQESDVSPLVSSSVGRGSSRRLMAPVEEPVGATEGAEPPPEGEVAAEGTHATASAPAPPAPTLAYGVKCFRNALLLCEASGGLGDYAALALSSAQGTLTAAGEISLGLHAVQRLALLQLSWCALTQGDHEQALSWSTALLALDDVPSNLKFYACMYAANALCYLSRSAEALPHLTEALQLGEAAPPESPPSAAEGEVASVRNPYSAVPQTAHAAGQAVARSMLHTNLATVHILSGDLKQASQCAQKALELQPSSRNALICLVYLEIRGGNLEAARQIMTKQVVPEPPAAPSS
mmetsp:Transcript_15395/g.38157  ORF Transcript_15395/g.38157 Transcript_15395/m.38157 type:complete len:701 (+) Transcript_15395:80-2182(+)